MSYLHIYDILITLEDGDLRFVLILSKVIFLVAEDIFRERVCIDDTEHLLSTYVRSLGYASIFLTSFFLFINVGPLCVTGFSK